MFLTADQFLLTTLVVKITIVAALATILVRYHRFRHILISERRAWPERLLFAFSLGVPLAAGVTSRLLLNYDAADLTLEGAFLAGLIAGPYAGAIVGLMVALPALVAGEFIALFFAVGCGFAGGGLREACPNKEEIWHFSPFVFTKLHRHVWRMVRNVSVDWAVIFLLAPVALEVLRQFLGWRFNHPLSQPPLIRLFYLHTEDMTTGWLALVVLTTVLCVATPIKIWNNARIEHRLEEQEKLLLTARVEALASQINPHFLFNTLTSIQSLIRTNPETARTVVVKLSGLLRRLLRSRDHFVTLREELESIDEYLDIEVIRFGPQLKVEKQISPDTLDVIVPSMILQPLVENSIKHGFSRKVGGGRIVIRSVRQNAHAIIEVEDDGLGMTDDRLNTALTDGIGLSNVNERLSVIYGAGYRVRITSVPNLGTIIRLEIPDMASAERITA
ncbi:MAG TPA: histidine kinase [Vicinamibacterales bacterium]|nr:histidine kinase [Vicinamibacterales bacterium]